MFIKRLLKYLPLSLKVRIHNRILILKGENFAKRHERPYTTHLPVLIGLAYLFRIEKVLEFGSGEHSTLTFLNEKVFSDLKRLDSFENDIAWGERVKELTSGDARIKLNLVNSRMSEVVKNACEDKYDLIFVDDSTTATERAATIREIADSCDHGSLVVIHDFEVAEYQKAASLFRNMFTFTAFNPHTGLVWNSAKIDERNLAELNKVLKKFADKIDPVDFNGWLNLIRKKVKK